MHMNPKKKKSPCEGNLLLSLLVSPPSLHHHVGVNGCVDIVLQQLPAPDATLNQPITSSPMHQGDTATSSLLPLLTFGMDHLYYLLHSTAAKPGAIAGSWLAWFCVRPVGRVGLYFLHWFEGKGARLGMSILLWLLYSFPCWGMFPQKVPWQALNQFVVPLFMMKLVHLFYVNSPWDCLLWHRDPCAFGDARNSATGSLFSLVVAFAKQILDRKCMSGEALGQDLVNVCCLCSFLCCFLAEPGWVSITGRRKTTHKNWYAFCTQGKINIIWIWAVILWASLQFLGLVKVQKHHGSLVHWLGSALWSPMGICDSISVLLQSKRREIFMKCVPQSWLGWGEAIPMALGCPFS